MKNNLGSIVILLFILVGTAMEPAKAIDRFSDINLKRKRPYHYKIFQNSWEYEGVDIGKIVKKRAAQLADEVTSGFIEIVSKNHNFKSYKSVQTKLNYMKFVSKRFNQGYVHNIGKIKDIRSIATFESESLVESEQFTLPNPYSDALQSVIGPKLVNTLFKEKTKLYLKSKDEYLKFLELNPRPKQRSIISKMKNLKSVYAFNRMEFEEIQDLAKLITLLETSLLRNKEVKDLFAAADIEFNAMKKLDLRGANLKGSDFQIMNDALVDNALFDGTTKLPKFWVDPKFKGSNFLRKNVEVVRNSRIEIAKNKNMIEHTPPSKWGWIWNWLINTDDYSKYYRPDHSSQNHSKSDKSISFSEILKV